MKKILCFVLPSIVAFSLFSCGNKTKLDSKPTVQASMRYLNNAFDSTKDKFNDLHEKDGLTLRYITTSDSTANIEKNTYAYKSINESLLSFSPKKLTNAVYDNAAIAESDFDYYSYTLTNYYEQSLENVQSYETKFQMIDGYQYAYTKTIDKDGTNESKEKIPLSINEFVESMRGSYLPEVEKEDFIYTIISEITSFDISFDEDKYSNIVFELLSEEKSVNEVVNEIYETIGFDSFNEDQWYSFFSSLTYIPRDQFSQVLPTLKKLVKPILTDVCKIVKTLIIDLLSCEYKENTLTLLIDEESVNTAINNLKKYIKDIVEDTGNKNNLDEDVYNIRLSLFNTLYEEIKDFTVSEFNLSLKLSITFENDIMRKIYLEAINNGNISTITLDINLIKEDLKPFDDFSTYQLFA